MKPTCMKFLSERLEELTLSNGVVRPFSLLPGNESIFFQELPTDFLKDNDYAVCCLPLIDRNVYFGKLIGKRRDLETKTLKTVRRRFKREITFRCLLYGPAEELYGTPGHTGLLDRFIQGVAEYHHILASDDSVIRIEPGDSAQPWEGRLENDRKLGRPSLGIVRVQFNGGVQVEREVALITRVEVTPKVE